MSNLFRHLEPIQSILKFVLLLSATALSAGVIAQDFSHDIEGQLTPWSDDVFDASDDRFTFAIFSDLYSGERDGVFKIALAQIKLLRPELILSVGDLIDGGTEDLDVLARQWHEFDTKLATASAPVFVVGGNHDLTNTTMREVWVARYGTRYYHFIYKNVLFLMLDSEDYEERRMQEIYLARAAALKTLSGPNPEKYAQSEYVSMPERATGAVSAEQASYFRRVIGDNSAVRWTFLLMHKPVWRNDNALEFQSIESALGERPYTVINGHLHAYSLTRRNDRDYIMLGTTSGGQDPNNPMGFDHITLITMDDSEPSIVNLRLDGILDKSGHIPLGGDDLCYQASACGENALQ